MSCSRCRIALRLVVERHHRFLERPAVEIFHDGDTGGLRARPRLVLEVAPFLAHELAGTQRALAENAAVLRRQARPCLLRHHEHFRAHGVLGQGVEACELVVVGGDEGRPVVLCAVDQPGGKAGQHLAIGQFDRIGAQCLDHVRHQFRLLHANAKSLEIGERTHRAHAVIDRTCAGIVEGEADESERFEAVQDLVADRAVQHLLHMLDRAEQERHRQHIHRRHEVPDQRDIGAIEIDRTGAGLLDRLLFLAQLARMENADMQSSAAAFLHQAAHIAQRLDGRIVLALGIGGAKFARQHARRRQRQQQRNDEGQGPRKVGAVHRQRLPLVMVSAAGGKGSTAFWQRRARSLLCRPWNGRQWWHRRPESYGINP